MKRIAILLLSAALLLGIFSGCAAENTPYVPSGNALVYDDNEENPVILEEETEPQEFSLAYYSDRPLNPFTCKDFTNRTIFSLIYQSLFSVSRDYEAMPILCQSYEISADYRTYTFHLAKDAKFSDGTAVTAGDVLASLNAAKESSYYGGRFTHISDISQSGSSIVIKLNTEMESLLLLLDIPVVKASQVSADSPLGSGPYILEKSISGAHLRKNDGWWCVSPDLAVTAGIIPLADCDSPIAIRDQFEFEDVGLVCADPCSDSYADFRCDYELWDCDNGIFLYLGVNVRYSEFFSENPKVISALTYAIDRDTLVDENYRGFAQAATLAASPRSPY